MPKVKKTYLSFLLALFWAAKFDPDLSTGFAQFVLIIGFVGVLIDFLEIGPQD